MRIRRQTAQPQSNAQGTGAENSNNGSLSSSPAVAEPPDVSAQQHDTANMHVSIEDLSMIYSASKFRASVNWLDRLRAAKGFPVDPRDLDVEEVLSSPACLPEETQRCCLEESGSACMKQESMVGMDVPGLACKNTGHKQCRVSRNSSCRRSPWDIKKSLSCNSGVAEVESLRSHTSRERSSTALHLQEHTHNNGFICTETSQEDNLREVPSSSAFATGKNSDGHNAGKHSRSTVIQASLCEDGNIKTALSQLYFNMFAELFCIESRGTTPLHQAVIKKRQRKQEKPKVCSMFADLHPPNIVNTSLQLQTCEFDTHPTCAIDSGNPTSQSEVAAVVKADIPGSSPEVEGVEATLSQSKKALDKPSATDSKKINDMELDGAPMNDLFIIDTSLPGWGWRTEKVTFRKRKRWRRRGKGTIIPGQGTASESMLKDAKKQVKLPLSSGSKIEPMKMEKQPDSDSSIKKNHKVDEDFAQCPNSTDHVARVWNIAPHTQMRSSRKRRKTTLAADEHSNAVFEATFPINEPTKSPTAFTSASQPCPIGAPAKLSTAFASDHPANQPKEGLVYSIYQVFMQAGKSGLTPREAVSRILEQGLPGLHEGGVVPRVEVLKIVSNSPYFMPLEESKYILCSALVGDEGLKVDSKQDIQDDIQASEHKDGDTGLNSENVKSAKQHGMSQYWAACAAIRRARTGTTRRKPSLGSYFLNSTIHETQEEIAQLANKKRLKSVKQDVTGLGNPCNRSDGKGWHCPLRAKVGYLLCDHHLDRLRTRVKSHIKSKMLSITKGSKEERKRILTGSWVVKKVVERSRTGRLSHAPCGVDIQDNFPVPTATQEVSGAKFYQI